MIKMILPSEESPPIHIDSVSDPILKIAAVIAPVVFVAVLLLAAITLSPMVDDSALFNLIIREESSSAVQRWARSVVIKPFNIFDLQYIHSRRAWSGPQSIPNVMSYTSREKHAARWF